MQRWMACFLLLIMAATPVAAEDEPARVVGRVYYIEGELSRYVRDENNWVDMVRDAPFGEGDTLYSADQSMTELIIPNGTWIRTGHETQIQFITLDAEITEVDVSKGMVRFYNKSPSTTIKATTAFGYVMADPDTAFDIYADSDSVEVLAVRGNVRFIHQQSEARYEVMTGSTSIIANQDSVSTGEGTLDASWQRWNESRESFWANRTRGERRSVRYLPPALHDESYILEEYGDWERVPYEGSPRWFWRPTRVAVGWSPFTVGRWTVWCGDQTWIPGEPFGYITHHYGNWVYMRNAWFWAPPVVSVQVGLPLLDIGYHWYPGRVSWIHRDAYVGWVPLAPREIYYSHYNWGGPYATVYGGVGFSASFGVSIGSYAFARHAIVVPQNRFYGVVNYRNVRVTNIHSTTIINNYRLAPVIDGSVIHNFSHIRERHFYGNKGFRAHPIPAMGIDRIRHNDMIIQQGRRERPAVIKERMRNMQEGKMHPDMRLNSPKGQFFEKAPQPRIKGKNFDMRAPQQNRMQPGHRGNTLKNMEIREGNGKGRGGHKGQMIQMSPKGDSMEMPQRLNRGQMGDPGNHGSRTMRAPKENRMQQFNQDYHQRDKEQGKPEKGMRGHQGQTIQRNPQRSREMPQQFKKGQALESGDHGKKAIRAPRENQMRPLNQSNVQRNMEVRGKPEKGHGGQKGQLIQGDQQGFVGGGPSFGGGHGRGHNN